MPYFHLDYQPLKNQKCLEAFEHADSYLHDVYGMFRALPPTDNDGGGGNFGIALILLCVVDGLAAEEWPGCVPEKRFKRLIREKLNWGPVGSGKWLHKGTAADQLYTKFRNPLVHELAQDKQSSSDAAEDVKPIVGKWGAISSEMKDIEKIDGLEVWKDEWPILSKSFDEYLRPRNKLALAAFYWAVKRMAANMIADRQSPP